MTQTQGNVLVFGGGWLGPAWAGRLPSATLGTADIADPALVAEELDRVRPDRVLNAAGKTGVTSVDALEGKVASTYRSNVVGPIVLASACRERDIHFTHLSSGCLYSGDNGGDGFAEDDPPNFDGSLYARTKALAEAALRDFDVLQLRIRLPISSVPHPRNLITKLITFEQVVRVANSVTILDDAWDVMDTLVAEGARGVWNLVNDGAEHHDELLALWREHVDPGHAFEVIDPADLDVAAPRSNCILSTAKLHARGLGLPHVRASLPRVIQAYADGGRRGDPGLDDGVRYG